MKACDSKLKSSLMEAMELDDARLEEEMKNYEPHVFSAEFESRMEELFKVQERKSKRRSALRFAAAAVVIALLAGGIIFIGSEDLRASKMSIDILEWLEDFFTVEDGYDITREDDDVLFSESQIGYIPEGFGKVSEHSSFTLVQYKYENDIKDYIIIRVSKDKSSLNVDNEEVEKEVQLNDAGYEYTRTYKSDTTEEIIMWKDDNDVYYFLTGTVDNSELVAIMNSISY